METEKDIFLNRLGQTNPFPFLIDVDYAEGLYIVDKNGKKYLDMISGVAVNNIGHRHPKVIQSIKNQLDKHLHVMVYGEFIQDSPNIFAKRLTNMLPKELNCVYTVNSGAEANEAAIKLAKRVTGRYEIISCVGAYHGSTHGALSISYNETKKTPFRPLLPGISFIKHNELEDLNKISSKTAAVIIEPIQGDAGVRIPDIKYMQALRNKCTQLGVQLIFDEIQCGMGRTGKLFAFEHFGVVPDILTLGKALGGGLPIGAFVSSKEKMKTLTNNPMLGHITTFGGNPVICASAAACLEVLQIEIDFNQVEVVGNYIEQTLKKSNKVISIRRIGLMFAIDLENEEKVANVVKSCLNNGLLTFWFLSHPYSFRLSPPLTITLKEAELACEIILNALENT